MNDEFNKVKNVVKTVIKKTGKRSLFMLILIMLITTFVASSIYFITIDDGTYKEGDWTSTPYGVGQYTSNISLGNSGELKTSMTAQELWDKMVENDSRVNLYLDKPEELLKLMNAEVITKYMDTRPNPDDKIDWTSINKIDSNDIQGIIKLKRKLSDGSTTSTMIYADPATFQSYIDEYNSSGSEEAKNNALSHFTLGSGTTTGGLNGVGIIKGTGSFTKYEDLTDAQIKAIANVCKQEQGTLKGAAAEASLIVNRFELYGSKYGTGGTGIYNYIKKSRWFGGAASYMDSRTPGEDYIAVVKSVLVNGKRTLPGYIDEHVTLGRKWIVSATNDGTRIDVMDRSAYVQNKTIIQQSEALQSGIFTFFCFPDTNSDPFGYTSEQNRSKIGDAYYDFDTGELVNGKEEGAEEEKKEEDNSEDTESIPSSEEWFWPTDGTRITSHFGPRKAPVAGASTNHGGIDIGVGTGTNVYACDAGKVITASYAGSAGNLVTIDHGNGYISKYMHNSQFKVSVGDTVQKGQIVALSGATGIGSGPHLHFQVEYNGTKVDPLTFKYNNGMGNGSVTPNTTANSNSGNTSQYYAVVASWNETIDKVENTGDNGPDPDVEQYENVTYSMTTTNINYQDLVSGYTMPFDYLWSMLVIAEDKDFVMDLADLVYNSEIEITVHDNLTINTNVNKYTYTKRVKTETTAKVTATGSKTVKRTKKAVKKSKTGEWTGERADEKDFNYTTTHTTITKTNTLDISVTLADVWMAKYTQDYEHEIPDKQESSSGGPMDDIPYPDNPSATGENDTYGHAKSLLEQAKNELKKEHSLSSVSGYIDYVKEKIYNSTINRNEAITNTVESTTYVATPMRAEGKIDKESTEPNFVTIFLDPDNIKAKNVILSVESWLFELIKTNASTEDLLDLTKFLLYKATGTDYGITEYDFDALYKSNLTSVGGQDYIVEITKSPENIVITDVETLKKAFSGYSGSVKIIEHAQEFLDLQEKYKVNAVFAAAVSISETSAGRGGHATDGKNNWFNIDCTCGDSSHGKYETYENAEKSIEGFYWLIAEGSNYFKQGNYTVTDIGMAGYCENADVPGGWIEDTNAFMTQMLQAAGIDTSIYVGEEGGITTEAERVALQNYIENELIHTKYHKGNSLYQNGPFAKWWNSPYNVLSKFQCTWWAYGKASMYLEQYGTKYKKYPKTPEGRSGNGGEWYDINKKYGWFNYGSIPKAHSVISWKRGGKAGHVAYVEGVTTDGIYISEAGSGKSWFGVRKIPLSGYYNSAYSLNGYIYLNEPK